MVTLYQRHNDGSIFQYRETPSEGWQKVDNNPATTAIVATHNALYQLHNDGSIFQYTGAPCTGWQLLDNNPATTALAAAGFGLLYQLHNDGSIWTYTGSTGWQLLDNNPATIAIVVFDTQIALITTQKDTEKNALVGQNDASDSYTTHRIGDETREV